jgi:ABC-2 type transport system permease protein
MRVLVAQARVETTMTLRRGETLLVTIGIPVAFVVFFSTVHVLPTTGRAVNFVVPGVLALAVMSTAMVSLGIATGFERGYGVLKRLGSTPLRRDRLVVAKLGAVLVVEVLQAAVLLPVGVGLGWQPHTHGGVAATVLQVVALVLLGTAGFGGLGLLLAGTLRAEVNLAVANGLYLVLLLLGGVLVPLGKLPHLLADVAKVFPAAALSGGFHAALGGGHAIPGESWVTLAAWALAAPVVAALTFRWE